MRNSLYDALQVDSSASVTTIQAALRTVVRRFWAVPRDASGDSEEAIRFAALAASILVDPLRRKDYDAALNPGVGAGPWRFPIANRDAATEGGTDARTFGQEGGSEVSQLTIVASAPKSLPGVDALSEPLPDGTSWSSPAVSLALMAATLSLWYALARSWPGWLELATLDALLASLVVTALAFALAAWLCRDRKQPVVAGGLSRLAIIKWRREASIFIGAPPPQQDTAWIFKLRLMELTRSAAGFVTSASPWRRLFARLVDYALTAITLYALIDLIDLVIPFLDNGFIVIRSVLVLPTLVVLSAIPAAALFGRVFGNTPGKWLLSLQLVTGVTRPADHATPTDRTLLWARASRVAWSGAALGFWPIALYRLPRNLRVARDTETDWEGSGDSLVMARPLTTLAVTTALVILVAVSLLLLSGWRRDYVAAWPDIVSATASVKSTFARLLPAQNTVVTAPVAEPTVVKSASATDSSIIASFVKRFGGSKSDPAANTPEVSTAAPPKLPAALPAPSTTANSAAEAELAKQANASNLRRLRIEAYASQVAAARRSGSYSGLQGVCERWSQDQPASGEAWRCLGMAQFQNGAGRQALPALRQALRFEPNDAQIESAILSILRP